ncbi:MAG: hypothetical protein EOO50_10205 [Flavobacterium sp.]|uniref:hypothetical protein n=1 Tax=Flavobacterium sp. TaxID=239 RepID=UPI0011FEB3BC|nr:hypothetical protein [Flavobacterium sp.]RZJ66295.1 MAG: hypothetical protein EOO50_10205 [Flavobacterium sp.]
MASKPISARQHGFCDWGFAAALFFLPRLMGVNHKAKTFYDIMGGNVVAINGTTDHGVGFRRLISVKTHEKLDIVNLSILYGMFAARMIRKDKSALAFHFGLTALATLHVLNTDYNSNLNPNTMTRDDKERDLENPGRQTDQPYNEDDKREQSENVGDDLESDDDNLDDGSGATERAE